MSDEEATTDTPEPAPAPPAEPAAVPPPEPDAAAPAEESASTVRFTMAARGQAVNESHEWSGARSHSGYAFATGAAYGSNTPVSRTSSSASWLFVSSRSACGSARSASTRFSASWW